MSSTGLQAIDHSVQLTHQWINELMLRLDWDSKPRAYRLLRETLHVLRDFLSVNEVAHLSAQLPLLQRGIYFEGWRPAQSPAADRSLEAFVARIESAFTTDPIDEPAEAIRAVFFVISNHISRGEVQDIASSLQRPLRDLWPMNEARAE